MGGGRIPKVSRNLSGKGDPHDLVMTFEEVNAMATHRLPMRSGASTGMHAPGSIKEDWEVVEEIGKL